MKKALFLLLAGVLGFFGFFGFFGAFTVNSQLDTPISCKTSIIGGGVVGALESYYAYKNAQKEGAKICITVY